VKALITGGRGQLALELRDVFRDGEVLAPTRAELDICSPDQVEVAIDGLRPDVVLNTAAFHTVDLCESEPEQSFLVNAAAPQRLAAACLRRGIRFVHYSTDYVFNGEARSPHPEDHPVAPLSVYGASKAAGEMAIRAAGGDYLIVRTTGLYGLAGAASKRGNFVETMLRLGASQEVTTVVCDQVLTPTSAADLARFTRRLIEAGANGTVHVTNSGQCSWYEFAAEIFRLAELPGRVEPITQAQHGTPARRPAYSVLAHGGLRRHGLPEPRPWVDALADYLGRRALLPAFAHSGRP
jgi:dTDP-4-dehydrorhamnose reductase